jgi:hypothetical protein
MPLILRSAAKTFRSGWPGQQMQNDFAIRSRLENRAFPPNSRKDPH